MRFWALVPASGIGSRMQADRPKQYLPLGSKTILETTLERLLSHELIEGLVLVLAAHDDYWPTLEFHSSKPLLIAPGGAERANSVLSGLECLQQHSLSQGWPLEQVQVLIHDAVRPCIRHEDLSRLMQLGQSHVGGALLAQPVTDTLKQANAEQQSQTTVPRAGLWRAQTPQMFGLQSIQQALHHALEQGHNLTDDASAMELQGAAPLLVEGSPDNLKITFASDLALAYSLLQAQGEGNETTA